MTDFVNPVGACGGEPQGGQFGPRDGSGPGAEGPLPGGEYDIVAIAVAAATALLLMFVGYKARSWKNFKKSLPSRLKKKIEVAHNEYSERDSGGNIIGKVEKLAGVCIDIDNQIFCREDARKAAGDFTALARALISHHNGSIVLEHNDLQKIQEAFHKVCRGIVEDKRWFFD